jgi:conjugative transfer region protein (TIGR03748 family)
MMTYFARKIGLLISFCGLALLVWSSYSWANLVSSSNVISYGRYQTISIQPRADQTDVLTAVIQVHFSPSIHTVNDAIQDLLRYSGYSLIDSASQSLALQNTLKKPLPLMHRDLGPIALRQVLSVLIGSSFDLAIDRLNRTVNFILKPDLE